MRNEALLYQFSFSFQVNLSDFRLVYGMTQYVSVLLGTVVLGPLADAFGRVKSLLACLFIAFIGGLSSAFAFNDLTALALCRGIAGFATGESVNICNINMATKLLRVVIAAEHLCSEMRTVHDMGETCSKTVLT